MPASVGGRGHPHWSRRWQTGRDGPILFRDPLIRRHRPTRSLGHPLGACGQHNPTGAQPGTRPSNSAARHPSGGAAGMWRAGRKHNPTGVPRVLRWAGRRPFEPREQTPDHAPRWASHCRVLHVLQRGPHPRRHVLSQRNGLDTRASQALTRKHRRPRRG